MRNYYIDINKNDSVYYAFIGLHLISLIAVLICGIYPMYKIGFCILALINLGYHLNKPQAVHLCGNIDICKVYYSDHQLIVYTPVKSQTIVTPWLIFLLLDDLLGKKTWLTITKGNITGAEYAKLCFAFKY